MTFPSKHIGLESALCYFQLNNLDCGKELLQLLGAHVLGSGTIYGKPAAKSYENIDFVMSRCCVILKEV